MSNNQNENKFVFECALCQTRFELWITATEWFSPEFAKYLKINFHRFCPICSALEEFKESEESKKLK